MVVSEVILFYGREGTPLVRRILPGNDSWHRGGRGVHGAVESGQFAPGTALRYWWRLVLADGRQVDTALQTFEYADTRFEWRTMAWVYVDLYWYGRDADRAQAILEAADEAVERLGNEMGVPIERRVRIYVYNSQRDMRPASTRSEAMTSKPYAGRRHGREHPASPG